MRSASEEWMARVAARNEIETAKAMRGLRAVALSAGASGSETLPPREIGREVAR